MVQTAAVQNFMEDPKQYGPPLRYRYHTFLAEPSLPAIVRVNMFTLTVTTSAQCTGHAVDLQMPTVRLHRAHTLVGVMISSPVVFICCDCATAAPLVSCDGSGWRVQERQAVVRTSPQLRCSRRTCSDVVAKPCEGTPQVACRNGRLQSGCRAAGRGAKRQLLSSCCMMAVALISSSIAAGEAYTVLWPREDELDWMPGGGETAL